MRMLGVFTLIPTTMLLTISFFVLFTVHKAEKEGLKKFGMVIAVLLWILAGMALGGGIFTLATGHPPMGIGHHLKYGQCCSPTEKMEKETLAPSQPSSTNPAK